MTLAVAWVTPFSRASDVSAFSRNVLLELGEVVAAKDGCVSVFVNENRETYWTALPVILLSGDARDREILTAFDLVIFNIGNNSGNHRHINWLVAEVPGVVIVHDMVMQHFFADEIFGKVQRKELYARLVGEYYGETGIRKVERSQICGAANQPIYAPWDSVHVVDMPLLEPMLHCAAAVIVHSRYAERFVAANFAGPILRLALSWGQEPCLTEPELTAWRLATATKTICSVVCFGYIGRGKCLDPVIKAFARSARLRRTARLTIAGYPGDAQYKAELETLVRDNDLGGVVGFEFSVSDGRLLALKRDADVFVNLRDPNTEGASGSMVEQMNAGKPVLVYPTGCYAEIDESAVIKVSKEEGVDGIAAVLEKIAADPAARISIGENGRRHARRMGRKEYVAGLLRFFRQHRALLRQRRRWTVGARLPWTALGSVAGDGAWPEQLMTARRLLGEFRLPRHELAVAPFQRWSNGALVAFVAFGLFGQTALSPCEHACAALCAAVDRAELYWIICGARMLWLLCNEDSAAGDPNLFRVATASPTVNPAVWGLIRSLGDETLAKALYIGLLGRRPGEDETAAYVARLASEPVGQVVREFLFSDEFKRRGGAQGQMAPLLRWCDGVKPTSVAYPPLELGATVYFANGLSDCRRYLGAGWHPVEAGHVWSRIAVATLQFSVANELLANGACVMVTGRFVGTAYTWARALQVRCNRAKPAAITADTDDWFWFTVELDRTASDDSNFALLFDAGETINPVALGINGDDRDLGFCLQAISLCRVERAAVKQEVGSVLF